MIDAYAIAFLISALICLVVARAAWRRRPSPGALGLAILCGAQFLWSGVYALQWLLTDHGPSFLWFMARLTPLQVTPTAILILVLDLTGRRAWLTRKHIALLLVQPITVWLLAATDGIHGLYLAGTAPTTRVLSGGPVFWFTIVYSYALILVAAALLVRKLRGGAANRAQTWVVLIAVMLPVLHFAAEVAGLDLLPQVNAVPFTFTLSGILEWFALSRLGLFRVIPIAREQLIEQMSDGIIVFDAQRRVADINPAAMRMLHVTGSCVGKTADEAFPQQAEAIAALRSGIEAGRPRPTVQAEYQADRVFEATASLVLGREGERLATLVTLSDVTEQLAAERMQRDFVANVAHELQTPLTGLSLLAETIPRAMCDDPASARTFVDRLAVETKRLVRMTNSLMTLSRVEGSAPPGPSDERSDLGRIATEEAEALEHLASAKSQTLVVDAASDAQVPVADSDARVLIGNLLENALRYTGEGGRIQVVVLMTTDDTGAPRAVLEVSDNGQGIPAADLDRIFERFYRVDKARSRTTGGAGLGLSIVRGIAQRYGGTVSVRSAPGKGATFTVSLPAE